MTDQPPKTPPPWPLLSVAAGMFLTAGVKGWQDGLADPLVAALMTSGLIAFGAWIAMEVRRR